jgi:hypothetical protein
MRWLYNVFNSSGRSATLRYSQPAAVQTGGNFTRRDVLNWLLIVQMLVNYRHLRILKNHLSKLPELFFPLLVIDNAFYPERAMIGNNKPCQ